MNRFLLFLGKRISQQPSLLLDPITWIIGGSALGIYAICENRRKKTHSVR